MAKGMMIVDGQRVNFDGEKNVLSVIRKAGIEMPTFCYYSDLSVYGACRMCVVEDEKTGKIDASCSMEPRDGMISWDRRIRYLRKRGVNAPIYATAGITCGASLLEAKQAGASGAFVGSCLMNLWDDEPAMLALLADLEQAANS